MAKHEGVKWLNYAERAGIQSARTQTPWKKCRSWVSLGCRRANLTSQCNSSLLVPLSFFLLSCCPPSLCVLSFSSAFYCCEAQRCLLTNQNILAGAKIQHLQAMQTSVGFAKTRMTFLFGCLPLRLSWMPSFHSSLHFIPLSHPTFCPHLLLLLAALSLFNDSIILT